MIRSGPFIVLVTQAMLYATDGVEEESDFQTYLRSPLTFVLRDIPRVLVQSRLRHLRRCRSVQRRGPAGKASGSRKRTTCQAKCGGTRCHQDFGDFNDFNVIHHLALTVFCISPFKQDADTWFRLWPCDRGQIAPRRLARSIIGRGDARPKASVSVDCRHLFSCHDALAVRWTPRANSELYDAACPTSPSGERRPAR
jgi:hypothetical protein